MSLDRGRTVFGAPAPGERVLACLRLVDDDRERWPVAADALLRLGEEGAEVVLPRHPDGISKALCDRLLGNCVRVVPPLEYLDCVATLRTATLVVTDSATVQDEASSLGVPLMMVGDGPEPADLRTADGEDLGRFGEGRGVGVSWRC